MSSHLKLGGVKRLLFIGAHPDDETFFAAGTFAKYVAAGAAVSVLCATRGQSGKTADLCSRDQLPFVRERELYAAMDALGVSDIEMLEYVDKQLSDAPPEQIRKQLVGVIRRTRPQVVITFDPNGANLHVDHIAISRFASDAIAAAADVRWFPDAGRPHRVERLLWTPPTMIYKLTPEMEIRQQPGFDFLIDTTAWARQKTAAFQAHKTQFPGLKKLFFDDPNGQRTFNCEAFRLAWGSRPHDLPAEDLFNGTSSDE